ncbi:lytic murein transglycosylase [Tateyamaria omphalii]|uniref:Murein transglycosylase n=1 Tax=Tateyamaria omphalii TaxID=299262 RepID=A0A1P8MYZ3_9RHOB|nr:lytic murein transglycosylase [Tateyamaria omphalii]APX13263.1 murein transglycosylase [Tateyamaria omphalii]
MRWAVTLGAGSAVFIFGSALAQPAPSSMRPELRPDLETVSRTQTLDPVVIAKPSVARPQSRPASLTQAAAPAVADSAADAAFQDWIKGFRTRARNQGISGTTFDRAFDGVRYDPDVIKRDRNQSEFTKTIWDYLDGAVSDSRVRNGKAALRDHARTLDAIEARYGVEKEVVVAVWGLESAFGAVRGSNDVIRSLATLAHDGRRGAFFEAQLIAALTILQSGDTSPRNMTGSWAGAMGHTQFMPTSYLDHAVDFTADGKRDIWSDDPTDALASTAAYLAKFGWTKGQPWGVEVTLPGNFNYASANRKNTRSPAEWARLGVVGVDGAPVGDHGPASILLPAGGQGVALMIFDNFGVIERYNSADAYVIGIGHLSDRIGGAPPFRGDWPRGDRALTYSERKEMQRRLTAAGFNTQGIDGRIGPKTLDAVRAFQQSQGLTADGYASLGLLKRLR